MLSRVSRFFEKTRSGGNYPYVTARVRAMKTHLLPESEYPKLIARDAHEIARSLEEGRYKDEIHELASRYSGAQLVEQATQRQLGNEFERILSWCEGEPADLLGLYFERFTVANLKTLLRGIHTDADRDDVVSALVPVGHIDRQVWETAASADSVEALLEALPRSRYTRIVEEMPDARLPEVENALDKEHYESLVDAVDPSDRAKEAFRKFLRREIDEVNLKLVLRAKHGDVEDYELVSGGRAIDEEIAYRIRGASWEEVGSILEETPIGEDLQPAIEAYRETGDLNRLTGVIEDLHLQEAENFSHLYPLSILPIIDYVLRKKLEVDRLRMIAFGKQTGLPREDIEELVGIER